MQPTDDKAGGSDYGTPEVNPAPVGVEVVKATRENVTMARYAKEMPEWLRLLLPLSDQVTAFLRDCAAKGLPFSKAFEVLCKVAVSKCWIDGEVTTPHKVDQLASLCRSDAPSITPFRVIEVLQHVLERDPDALHHLLEFREPVSEELADGGVVFVTGDSPPRLGLIGLLNGLFGQATDGRGFIFVHYDDATVTGFSVNPNAPKPRRSPAEQRAADWAEFKAHEAIGDKILRLGAAAGYGADDDLDEALPPRTCSIDGEACESCT